MSILNRIFNKKTKGQKESDKLLEIFNEASLNGKAFLMFFSILKNTESTGNKDMLDHRLIVSRGFKLDDIQISIDHLNKLADKTRSEIENQIINNDKKMENEEQVLDTTEEIATPEVEKEVAETAEVADEVTEEEVASEDESDDESEEDGEEEE